MSKKDNHKKGKEFERKSFEILKRIYDDVEWLSEKKKSKFDFKCKIGNKIFYGEAKFKKQGNPVLSYGQEKADFIITNNKDGFEIIPNSEFNKKVCILRELKSIKVSDKLHTYLLDRATKREDFEDVIWRLIGQKQISESDKKSLPSEYENKLNSGKKRVSKTLKR